MKAIVQDRYGPPEALRPAEIDRPAPGKGRVLVRVHAAGVNPADVLVMTGVPYIMRLGFGPRRPRVRVRGMDLAGTVIEAGPGVTRFRPGDQVYGEGEGTLAEYALARTDRLSAKPANLTFAQAAAVPMAGLTALHAIRDHGRAGPGSRVLIIGAAGGIGSFAVQIAKWLGAEVTGVCRTRNVELVRSLGADRVIDYTREDVLHSGQQYDLILDNAASHSLSELRRLLTAEGTLLPNSGNTGGRWTGPLPRMARAAVMSLFGSRRRRLRLFVSTPNPDDLAALSALLESGSLTPVIDQTYPLDQAPEALRHVATGHTRGKVLVTIEDQDGR